MVREAHTRLIHGELIPIEITAACFDPGYQLLVTGARNGTLKVPFLTGESSKGFLSFKIVGSGPSRPSIVNSDSNYDYYQYFRNTAHVCKLPRARGLIM